MYAVILTGGKQYKVEKDLIVKVEKIDANIGDKITFDAALINNDGKIVLGTPSIEKAVEAEVIAQDKAKKIIVYKYKAKKNERKRQGHRQPFTAVKILNIKG